MLNRLIRKQDTFYQKENDINICNSFYNQFSKDHQILSQNMVKSSYNLLGNISNRMNTDYSNTTSSLININSKNHCRNSRKKLSKNKIKIASQRNFLEDNINSSNILNGYDLYKKNNTNSNLDQNSSTTINNNDNYFLNNSKEKKLFNKHYYYQIKNKNAKPNFLNYQQVCNSNSNVIRNDNDYNYDKSNLTQHNSYKILLNNNFHKLRKIYNYTNKNYTLNNTNINNNNNSTIFNSPNNLSTSNLRIPFNYSTYNQNINTNNNTNQYNNNGKNINNINVLIEGGGSNKNLIINNNITNNNNSYINNNNDNNNSNYNNNSNINKRKNKHIIIDINTNSKKKNFNKTKLLVNPQFHKANNDNSKQDQPISERNTTCDVKRKLIFEKKDIFFDDDNEQKQQNSLDSDHLSVIAGELLDSINSFERNKKRKKENRATTLNNKNFEQKKALNKQNNKSHITIISNNFDNENNNSGNPNIMKAKKLFIRPKLGGIQRIKKKTECLLINNNSQKILIRKNNKSLSYNSQGIEKLITIPPKRQNINFNINDANINVNNEKDQRNKNCRYYLLSEESDPIRKRILKEIRCKEKMQKRKHVQFNFDNNIYIKYKQNDLITKCQLINGRKEEIKHKIKDMNIYKEILKYKIKLNPSIKHIYPDEIKINKDYISVENLDEKEIIPEFNENINENENEIKKIRNNLKIAIDKKLTAHNEIIHNK